MAKIPATPRLIVEDFPDQQTWIGKLLDPLNGFMSSAVYALTGHLTFQDNLLGQQQVIDFTYNGTQTLPILFLNNMKATPGSLLVVRATENLNTPIAVVVAWTVGQNGQIQITDLTKLSQGVASGLVVGARYQITLRITP